MFFPTCFWSGEAPSHAEQVESKIVWNGSGMDVLEVVI